MAHHKSALKRIKIAKRNRLRNRYYVSSMKSTIKKVLSIEKKEEAFGEYKKAASLIDKMVNRGIIHKNRGANKKSRLMRYVNNLT